MHECMHVCMYAGLRAGMPNAAQAEPEGSVQFSRSQMTECLMTGCLQACLVYLELILIAQYIFQIPTHLHCKAVSDATQVSDCRPGVPLLAPTSQQGSQCSGCTQPCTC